jgi:hypothetical protein
MELNKIVYSECKSQEVKNLLTYDTKNNTRRILSSTTEIPQLVSE